MQWPNALTTSSFLPLLSSLSCLSGLSAAAAVLVVAVARPSLADGVERLTLGRAAPDPSPAKTDIQPFSYYRGVVETLKLMWYSSQDLNDDLNDNDDDYISHNGPLMCLKVWQRILAPPPLEVPAQPVKLWMFRALLQSTLPIGLVITMMVTLNTKSGSCRRFGTATIWRVITLDFEKDSCM